jgi:hypothetical protein
MAKFSAISRCQIALAWNLAKIQKTTFALASGAGNASKPAEDRSPEPFSSSTMWLSECDRIFIVGRGAHGRSF